MHEDLIRDLFDRSDVAMLLGIEMIEVGEGRAKGRLVVKREHLNPFGNAHGGILFTLSDHVGGACANTMGRRTVLVESSIQYLKGITEGTTIVAEATLTHWGRTIGRIEGRVFDEEGNVIALGHHICYIKDADPGAG